MHCPCETGKQVPYSLSEEDTESQEDKGPVSSRL